MKIKEPYRCDICHKEKEGDRQWAVGIHDATISLPIVLVEKVVTVNTSVVILPWIVSLADRPDAAHLCQADCVEKWTAKQVAKLLAQPEVQGDEEKI